MTYIQQETSIQDGSPVFLFQFTQGVLVWRYTSTVYPVDYNGHTWVPTSITPGAITQSGDMTKDTLSFKFPRGHEFARQFLGYTPDQVTTVTVFRGHLTDSDTEYLAYWKGRVASFKASGESLSVECEPIFTSLRRPGLRARWQRSCRHALYSRGCGLDSEDFATDGLCTFANSVNIVVPIASSLPAGWLIGGMVRSPDGVLRYIVEHSGENIKLIRPVESLIREVAITGSAAVKLYPGCDHTKATCTDKFDNLFNYGGFPWIPSKNPFGGSSIA